MIQTKIIKSYKELSKIKSKRKIIGLCHGVFDILHSGHLEHLKVAKEKVDILVVSITADEYINKGPFQPINNSYKRISQLSSLEFVDYVFINKEITSLKVLNSLKPDLYIKGKDYKNGDFTKNLLLEKKTVEKNNGNLFFTETNIMSSTKIINNYFSIWDKDQKKFLNELSKNYNFDYFLKIFEQISNLEINIIGEIISDKYVFVSSQGLTSKDPALSMLNEKSLNIPGGVVAIAKILSNFVKKVNLFTVGAASIKKELKNTNITLIDLNQKFPLQVKTRFINNNRSEKILQVSNFKNYQSTNHDFSNILKKKIKNNLFICDYGIGMFNKNLIVFLEKLKIKKFINVQTNSLNLGFNKFTKYSNYNYMCLDRREWEIGLEKQTINSNDLKNFSKKKSRTFFSMTDGKYGSYNYSNGNEFFSPVFIKKTVDTTGCGDAYFAITSLLYYCGFKKEIISFVGNVYAGMHSQFYGNGKITNKDKLLKYLKTMINF